jgi:Dyp-type peroxidase family
MTEVLEKNEIQSLVLSGFPDQPFGRFVLLGVLNPGPARRWLRQLASEVSTTDARPKHAVVNVAFSAEGLRALGLDQESLATFSVEFQEGMRGVPEFDRDGNPQPSHRSRILGDTEESAPANWDWGGNGEQPVHAVLFLYGATETELDTAYAAQRAAYVGSSGWQELSRRDTYLPADGREHFGFADGITQPDVVGSGARTRKDPTAPPVKAGEFVLGYLNEYDKFTPSPSLSPALDRTTALRATADGRRRDFGRNGTYVVLRQLAQDVELFWRTMDQQSRGPNGKTDRDAAIRLASKCVGRWPSGAPLARSPDRDDSAHRDDNSFGFADDRAGMRCPVGAHIRRSNPRDSLEPGPEESRIVVNRHRILRRGRLYGPPLAPFESDAPKAERGLFFVCVNANIRRQFEFIQQTWLNNRKFDGLYRDKDPLTGDVDATKGGGTFTIPREPERQQLTGLPRFVTARGGEYFFLPSRRALRALGALEG